MLRAPSHAGRWQSAARVRRRPSSLTVFAARMNSLSLQNSNLIIIPHCLSKFPALSKLDLSRNQLESVDSAFILRHLPQLLNLDLSNNRISNVAQIQVRE
jgi:Leucine-rich repeat (LRR) protein